MPHSPFHIATKTHPITKKTTHPVDAFDRLVLFISVLYPFSALPQAVAVFQGNTEGVSLISWLVFLICASLFLIYGLRKKVPPMIISNSIWIIMDALVVIGLLAAGGSAYIL